MLGAELLARAGEVRQVVVAGVSGPERKAGVRSLDVPAKVELGLEVRVGGLREDRQIVVGRLGRVGDYALRVLPPGSGAKGPLRRIPHG